MVIRDAYSSVGDLYKYPFYECRWFEGTDLKESCFNEHELILEDVS